MSLYSVVLTGFRDEAAVRRWSSTAGVLLDWRPDLEVIVVDDRIYGPARRRVQRLELVDPRVRKVAVDAYRGFGGAVLAGVAHARGDAVAWARVNAHSDPRDLIRVVERFERGGCRAHWMVKGRRYGRALPDALLGLGRTAVGSAALGQWVGDVGAQPTLVPRSFFAGWKPVGDQSFDLQAIVRAGELGYRIVRIPVADAARGASSSWSWGHAWSALALARRDGARLAGGLRAA